MSSATVFGSVDAIPGNKYHWKIKVLDNEGTNIGIMQADKCIKHANSSDSWWNYDYAWSYYSAAGHIFHRSCNTSYGEVYGAYDIIDIWVDLKVNNELSFGRNERSFGKAADLKPNATYKLVIGLYGGSVKLLHFDTQY